MIARQLHQVRADVVEQGDVGRRRAEAKLGLPGVRRRAVLGERDFVADVCEVSLPQPVTDIACRIGQALAFHPPGRGPGQGSNAGHDHGRHAIRKAIAGRPTPSAFGIYLSQGGGQCSRVRSFAPHAERHRQGVVADLEVGTQRRLPIDRQHLPTRVEIIEGHECDRRAGIPGLVHQHVRLDEDDIRRRLTQEPGERRQIFRGDEDRPGRRLHPTRRIAASPAELHLRRLGMAPPVHRPNRPLAPLDPLPRERSALSPSPTHFTGRPSNWSIDRADWASEDGNSGAIEMRRTSGVTVACCGGNAVPVARAAGTGSASEGTENWQATTAVSSMRSAGPPAANHEVFREGGVNGDREASSTARPGVWLAGQYSTSRLMM